MDAILQANDSSQKLEHSPLCSKEYRGTAMTKKYTFLNKIRNLNDHQMKTETRKALPFCCSNGNLHSNIPCERANRTNITMEPLFQIAVIDVFIYKHPKEPEVSIDKLEGSQRILLSTYF